MRVNVVGTTYEFYLEGPVSEKTEIFSYKINEAKEIIVDFDRLTFFNSIGVLNWTSWIVKIPFGVKLTLRNCPLLVMNQIHSVHGFIPKGTRIESIKAPFICGSCSSEKIVLLKIDADYDDPKTTSVPAARLPEKLKCAKCNHLMEPDFTERVMFSFLNRR